MCVGPFFALVGLPAPPGSVYRSHETFQRLWHDIQFDNSTGIEVCFVGFLLLQYFPPLCLVSGKM